jgi:hypothetical protein
MTILFTFVPSEAKPMDEFFNNEQCDIVRTYGSRSHGRGYFVVTKEVGKATAYLPAVRYQMWHTKKHPSTTRLADKVVAVREVGK